MIMPSGAEDLRWGQGARILEIFLEPTCPHSAKAFEKLIPLVENVGNEYQVAIRLNAQPWHTFSSPICRAILASALGNAGKNAALKVMQAVFDERDRFVLNEHRDGPNLKLSIADIVACIEALSEVEITALFSRPEVTQDLKWHTRYSRQNGIHGTPSFMLDGLITEKMSSRQSVEEWSAFLSAN